MPAKYGDLEIPIPAPGAGGAVSDPALTILLSFFKAVINAKASAAWNAVAPGAGGLVVKSTFAHNPAEEAFRPETTPALYLWRDSIMKARQIAADWRVRPSALVLRWVPFPVFQQERQRRWDPFFNAIPSLLDNAVERGRDPSWVVPGDTDPYAATRGSLLWSYLSAFKLEVTREEAKRGQMVIPVQADRDPVSIQVLDIPIDFEERLTSDPDAYDELTGVEMTFSVPGDVATEAATPALTGVLYDPASDSTSVTLTGSNFFLTSVAYFSGVPVPTTWVSAGVLHARIARVPGVYAVTVRNSGSSAPESNSVALTIEPEFVTPTLASVTPATGLIGAGDVALTLAGTSFIAGVTVAYAGATALVTTVLSPTSISAILPAALQATAGIISITVDTPAPGAGVSNAQTFTSRYAAPTTSSLGATTVIFGSGAQSLVVNGSNFYAGVTVARVDGVDVVTTVASSSQLTATIPSGVVAVAGAKSITVFNPTPGGGTSGAQTYTVQYGVPTLGTPSSVTGERWSGAQTLTLPGTNFTPAAQAKVDGVNVATTFNSSTSLTAVIPRTALWEIGARSITVADAGGTTSAKTYAVTQPTYLVGEYRADMGLTMNAGSVQVIPNQVAGDANTNLVQLTPAKQPPLTASDAAYNNQPTIVFNGARILISGTWANPLQTGSTHYFVGEAAGMSGGQIYDGSALRQFLGSNANGTVYAYSGSAINSVSTAVTAKAIVRACFGAGGKILINSKATADVAGNTGVQILTGLSIGGDTAGTPFFKGKFAMMLLTAGEPSTAQNSEIMDFLATKYARTVSP